MSVIAVEDLGRLLLKLATSGSLVHQTVEPDDGRPNGWDQRDFARALGKAMGSSVLPIPLPRPVLNAVAAADGLIRGRKAKLTPDRVRYFCHRDWVSHDHPPMTVWTPKADTEAALTATAQWYRAQRLL